MDGFSTEWVAGWLLHRWTPKKEKGEDSMCLLRVGIFGVFWAPESVKDCLWAMVVGREG